MRENHLVHVDRCFAEVVVIVVVVVVIVVVCWCSCWKTEAALYFAVVMVKVILK